MASSAAAAAAALDVAAATNRANNSNLCGAASCQGVGAVVRSFVRVLHWPPLVQTRTTTTPTCLTSCFRFAVDSKPPPLPPSLMHASQVSQSVCLDDEPVSIRNVGARLNAAAAAAAAANRSEWRDLSFCWFRWRRRRRRRCCADEK